MESDIVIERDNDVRELVKNLGSEKIKVVIGLRRAGKSYLLKNLFKNELMKELHYSKSDIVIYDLDSDKYRNIRSNEAFVELLNGTNKNTKIIIIDEVQKAGDGYEELLIDFKNSNKNFDIYITGSNSNSLSNDILNKYKEYAERIPLKPVSLKQVQDAIPEFTVDDYFKYGSLPIVVKRKPEERLSYLKKLYEMTYLSDICDRCKFKYISNEEMRHIINHIVSNLENPITTNAIYSNLKIGKIKNEDVKATYKKEISDFIKACVDSFLLVDFEDGHIINEDTPSQYRDTHIKKYCFDIGLLNVISSEAPINKKNSCAIENMVFLELLSKDITPVGKMIKNNETYKSIDFFFIKDEVETYLQVEFTLNENCYDREIGNLLLAPHNSRKVNVFNTNNYLYPIAEGVENLSIEDFLAKSNI